MNVPPSNEIVSGLTVAQHSLKVAIVVFAVGAIWRNIQARKEFVKRHPPLPYVPPADGPGRWRFGPVPSELSPDLQSIDGIESSRVTLPERRMGSQFGASLFGWPFMALGIWLLFAAPLGDAGEPLSAAWRFGPPLAFFFFGFALTYIDVAMRVIELTPHTATFIGRHGFIFYQRVVIKRGPSLKFTGKTESSLTMHRDQGPPNFILNVGLGFGRAGRLMFMCTPAQGAWIRDALSYWASGSQPRPDAPKN